MRPTCRSAAGGEFKKVPGVLIAALPIDHRVSLYARLGDWLAWGCWVIVAAGLVLGFGATGGTRQSRQSDLESSDSLCYRPPFGLLRKRRASGRNARREPMPRTLISAMLIVLASASAAPPSRPAGTSAGRRARSSPIASSTSARATEVADGKTNGFSSKLTLTKRWQVNDVDTDGVATLSLSLTAMRHEVTPPGRPAAGLRLGRSRSQRSGPEDGAVEVRRQRAGCAARGRLWAVVEVKESKYGPASKFESDLPFKLVVPDCRREGRRCLGAQVQDHAGAAAGHRREVRREADLHLRVGQGRRRRR